MGLSPKATPKDTLIAYQKIIKARNEIIEGKPFSEIAKKFSDDRSVKSNGGDLIINTESKNTEFQLTIPRTT